MLATITNAINNALRMNGRDVPHEHYRTEESFMPGRKRAKPKPAPTWSGVVKGLGFK